MSLVDEPPVSLDVRRPAALATAIALLLVAIGCRLWYLQIRRGYELLRQAENNRFRVIRRVPPRGLILDSRGAVIATNRTRIVVWLDPQQVRGADSVYDRLARLVGQSADDLRSEFAQNKANEFDPVRVAADVDITAATAIEERRAELPGVLVGAEPVRHYPDGRTFCHIIGQLGQVSPDDLRTRAGAGYRRGDYCGKLGLEGGEQDRALRGVDGGAILEVNAKGQMRRQSASYDALPGATLALNIRSDVQRAAVNGLRDLTRRGKPGAAVAMDPNSGAVIALASSPTYDPNLFVAQLRAEDWRSISTDRLHPLLNRAVGAAVSPGSTFKLVTTGAGMETGETYEGDATYCSGVIHLGRWPKRCHKRSGHGAVGLTRAMAVSCDVFFYRLGQRLGPERLARFARGFGLGTKTLVDLPRVETAGIVPDPAWKLRRKLGRWVGGDTVDFAIGQSSLACTPMQMCTVTAAVANGGTIYKPRLVRSAVTYGPGGARKETVYGPVRRARAPVGPAAIAAVQRGMRAALLSGGTASALAIPGLEMAGKTGTAQRRAHGTVVNDSWFVCYAPYRDPRIAVCVYIEEGGDGGQAAGPVARAMVAAFLGVPAPPPSQMADTSH